MKIWKRYSVGQLPKVAAHATEWRRVLGLARSIGERGASTCNYPSHYIIVTSSLEQQIVYTGIAGIAGIKGNWVILVWQVGLVLLVSKVSGVLKVTG